MTPRLRATMSLTTLAWALPRCSRRPTPAEIRFRPCSWLTTPHRPVVLTSWTSSGPCQAYGVTDTLLLERGGVTYGIFGPMGTDSDDCAPRLRGFTLEDLVQAAQRCVDSLGGAGCAVYHRAVPQRDRRAGAEVGGPAAGQEVEGPTLASLSGHTHTTLTQPIVEGDTYIVSAGPYCENLGSITLEWSEDGSKTLVDYQLIPIDQTLPEDQEIASLVEEWKAQVGVDYLAATT
ncbi:MAG: hypothetical protein ACLUJG_01660 [Lawsonibacter sp.]